MWCTVTDDPKYVDGQFIQRGTWNARPMLTRSDYWWDVWWDTGTSKWTITETRGEFGAKWWTRSDPMVGIYAPQGTATHNVALSPEAQGVISIGGTGAPSPVGLYPYNLNWCAKSSVIHIGNGWHLYWSIIAAAWVIAATREEPPPGDCWTSATLEGGYTAFGAYGGIPVVALWTP